MAAANLFVSAANEMDTGTDGREGGARAGAVFLALVVVGATLAVELKAEPMLPMRCSFAAAGR